MTLFALVDLSVDKGNEENRSDCFYLTLRPRHIVLGAYAARGEVECLKR